MPEPGRDEMTDLLFKINEILWKDWDPIGVYQEPMPDVFDEYSGYANEILDLLYQYEIQRDKLENRLREIVRDEMGLTLPETVDAATKILGEWNDPGTMEALADVSLKLAKNPQIEEKFRIRALRSFLRVPRQFDLPIPKKLEMCRAGFETAWRNEEKLLIFDVFSRAIHPDTIEAAAQYVQYDFCREAACQSIMTVAKELKSKSPKSAEILAQIAEKTTDPELAKQARALAEALK